MGSESRLRMLRALLASILLPPALAACASLAGSPPRVVSLADSLSLVSGTDAPYRMDRALIAFDDDPTSAGPDDHGVIDLRHGRSPLQYRNMVVTLYLNAADAQYADWRSRVSDERRELGLGFDSAVIGLTGIASVARQSMVRALTATASIMAGTRGAIDRNIYFDRTLPGLLASMDAGRLRIRAEITRHLSDTVADYPLASAFADISNYELAASLDRAIEDVTAQASEDRAAAQREYVAAIHACHSTEDLRANRATILGWLRDSGRTNEQLRALAGLVAVTSLNESEPLAPQIERALRENYCSNAQLQSLISSIRAQPWGKDIP